MTVEEIHSIIDSIQTLATLIIAFAVYRQAKILKNDDTKLANALKQVEIQTQAIQAYNVLNKTAVSSIENLMTLDTMGRDTTDEPIELRRKRWCAFIWLEALQVTHNGLETKMISEEYARRALDQQLKIILNHDFVYTLVCERGFDPKFESYCKKIKDDLNKIDKAKT